MPVTGPDFLSLQARDLGASQAFYEQYLGLIRSQAGPPHAVVFETKPIAFALRDPTALRGMAKGTVPGRWARDTHPRWYQREIAKPTPRSR